MHFKTAYCEPRLSRSSSRRLAESLEGNPVVVYVVRSLIFAALVSGALAPAAAQTVSGSVGATSDFVFRGLSLTRGEPAAQASIDAELPGQFYAGVFAATADPNAGPSPNVEFDAWLGRYWRLADEWSADLRLSQYTYPDDPRRFNYNRTELTGTIGFRDSVHLAAIYSPNTKAIGSSPGYREGDSWAYELSARRALSDRWSVSAGVGHYALDDIYGEGWLYWNATVTASLAPFELQLAYVGVGSAADDHFDPKTTGDRVALTALWRFPSPN
jgi:uncharacterized protein (TIGR02001 family)